MSYKPVWNKVKRIIAKSEEFPPLTQVDIQKWLSGHFLDELLSVTCNEWVLIHLVKENLFINSFSVEQTSTEFLVSESVLDHQYPCATHAASYVESFGGGSTKYSYEREYSSAGQADVRYHPLFFRRSFDGFIGARKNYYEILQEFIHVSGLHWVEKKNAYCDLSEVGDLQEKVVILEEDGLSAIFFERDCLDLYLLHREHVLVRHLELSNALPAARWEGKQGRTSFDKPGKGQWWRIQTTIPEDLSEACGWVWVAEVIQPCRTIIDIERKAKIYETFWINDIKKNEVVESSCDPETLDSYFSETGKPLQTSPAFFKADVLMKYKTEHEKYRLRERDISCVGAWSLKSYDINSEGQVHTYICYLGDLPHREQLHWKQYNEKPAAGISERAFKTDFLSEWSDDYDAVRELKRLVQNFPAVNVDGKTSIIWRPKEDLQGILGRIHPVSAGKFEEYKSFLLNLTILTVDGFDEAELRKIVINEKEFHRDLRSLGLLEILLLKMQTPADEVGAIIKPLRELQRKRSKFVGHGGGVLDFDVIHDSKLTAEMVQKSFQALLDVISKV